VLFLNDDCRFARAGDLRAPIETCDAGGRWGRNDSLAVEHGNHSKFGPDMLASPLFREIIVRFAQKFLGVHPWSEGVDWDPIA